MSGEDVTIMGKIDEFEVRLANLGKSYYRNEPLNPVTRYDYMDLNGISLNKTKSLI